MEQVDHPDDYLRVNDAAKKLGVPRNSMKQIPVRRQVIWQTECYLWSELRAWAEKDEKSPRSLLVALRGIKGAAKQRQQTRDTPRTKTGKVKKRYRKVLYGECPKCRRELVPSVAKNRVEHFADGDEVYEDAAVMLAAINKMAGGAIQHIVDQQPPKPPELVVEEVEVRVLRCPKCGFQKDEEYEYFDPADDHEERKYRVDDDILRMTTTTFDPSTGHVDTVLESGEGSDSD